MTKEKAIAEVFITAFKSLPQKERENIAQKLFDELDVECFSLNDWSKIEKLTGQRGKICICGKEAKQHLDKL